MLVQPQQAATVCEFDLVPHTIRSLKRAQTLDPNPPAGSSHEPLDLTLDLEYAHVNDRSRSPAAGKAELEDRRGLRLTDQDASGVQIQGSNSPRRRLGQLLTS